MYKMNYENYLSNMKYFNQEPMPKQKWLAFVHRMEGRSAKKKEKV